MRHLSLVLDNEFGTLGMLREALTSIGLEVAWVNVAAIMENDGNSDDNGGPGMSPRGGRDASALASLAHRDYAFDEKFHTLPLRL